MIYVMHHQPAPGDQQFPAFAAGYMELEKRGLQVFCEGYCYRADETRRWYLILPCDVLDLGIRLLDKDPNAYSLWASQSNAIEMPEGWDPAKAALDILQVLACLDGPTLETLLDFGTRKFEIATDLASVRETPKKSASLLSECLAGIEDPELERRWRAYVAAVLRVTGTGEEL